MLTAIGLSDATVTPASKVKSPSPTMRTLAPLKLIVVSATPDLANRTSPCPNGPMLKEPPEPVVIVAEEPPAVVMVRLFPASAGPESTVTAEAPLAVIDGAFDVAAKVRCG